MSIGLKADLISENGLFWPFFKRFQVRSCFASRFAAPSSIHSLVMPTNSVMTAQLGRQSQDAYTVRLSKWVVQPALA
jgi:hypothetical protein